MQVNLLVKIDSRPRAYGVVIQTYYGLEPPPSNPEGLSVQVQLGVSLTLRMDSV